MTLDVGHQEERKEVKRVMNPLEAVVGVENLCSLWHKEQKLNDNRIKRTIVFTLFETLNYTEGQVHLLYARSAHLFSSPLHFFQVP